MSKYLRPREVRTALGSGPSEKTLANLRSKGGGPAYIKKNNRIYYRYEDVIAWLESGLRTSTSAAMREAHA